MKTLSLKLEDSIFGETENILLQFKISRNKYINEALEYYNRYQKRLLLEKQLKTESVLVAESNKNIAKDFSDIDFENETI